MPSAGVTGVDWRTVRGGAGRATGTVAPRGAADTRVACGVGAGIGAVGKPGELTVPEALTRAPPSSEIRSRAMHPGQANRLTRDFSGSSNSEPGNASDPLLSSIDDDSVRRTLIAKKGDAVSYRFDFVLQGENETAFLYI